jgi:hypothetical protein
MPLIPGQTIFTDPLETQLVFPPGDIALHGMFAEVVDPYNKSVPLYEVYNHHWVFYHIDPVNFTYLSTLGECPEIPFVFGTFH